MNKFLLLNNYFKYLAILTDFNYFLLVDFIIEIRFMLSTYSLMYLSILGLIARETRVEAAYCITVLTILQFTPA